MNLQTSQDSFEKSSLQKTTRYKFVINATLIVSRVAWSRSTTTSPSEVRGERHSTSLHQRLLPSTGVLAAATSKIQVNEESLIELMHERLVAL